MALSRRGWFKVVSGIAILTVILDQVTKWLILNSFSLGESMVIIPSFFDLTLAYNKGVAFGVLADLPEKTRNIILVVTVGVALTAVLYLLLREYRGSKLGGISLAMILGGAVGNIIDRVLHGHVIDFLDFYIGELHWPAFNVADSAICVGVAILLFCHPVGGKQPKSQ